MRRALVLIYLLVLCCLGSYDPLSTSGVWLINAYKTVISPLQGHNVCNFWPTCSQFTREAISTRGFLEGTIVGADRLMRCSPAAWSYAGVHYRGITHDRLNDPVSNHLLGSASDYPVGSPALHAPPSLRLSGPNESLAPTGEPEPFDFADHLYETGEFTRASTEYLRVAFLADDDAVRDYARLMAGESFLAAADYERARTSFLAASHSDFARYGEARARFAQRDYQGARRALAAVSNTGLAARGRTLAGWSFYRELQFREAAAHFSPAPSAELAPLAEMDGTGISRRSRLAATLLAAALPGAGHAYAGRTADGVYTLLTVASSGLLTWYFADHPQKDRTRIKTSLFGSLTALFYAANLYGANVAARDHNRLQETRYLVRAESLLEHVDLAPRYPIPGDVSTEPDVSRPPDDAEDQ